jgi:hydrogenase/urease accessory protein HupE
MIMRPKNRSGLTNQKRVKLVSRTFFFCACYSILSSLFFTIVAFSHEVRPAYLELHQTSGDTYDVLWKVPGQGEDLRLGLYVQLPESCSNLSQPRGAFAANAYAERWTIKCAMGLSGGTIRIAGLSATLTDVLVRLERLEGTTQVTRLTPAMPSFVVEAAPSRMEIVRTYLALGVEHILTGVDHLLFVLGLLLLVRAFGRLVKTVSAFTVAHSVTLALATLGFVHVPSPPVEAVIALSIVFVAKEILRSHGRSPSTQPSLTERQPWLVAFSFGLLHGLGFAGGLSQVGLPEGHIPLALLLFSIGVEVGHFSFIAAVFAFMALGRWMLRRVRLSPLRPQFLGLLRLLPPYAIGGTAMLWLIERLAAF